MMIFTKGNLCSAINREGRKTSTFTASNYLQIKTSKVAYFEVAYSFFFIIERWHILIPSTITTEFFISKCLLFSMMIFFFISSLFRRICTKNGTEV